MNACIRRCFVLGAAGWLLCGAARGEPSARYQALGLNGDLIDAIPAGHILAYRARMENRHPFSLRAYLKDLYMLRLAEPAPASAAIAPEPEPNTAPPGTPLQRATGAGAPPPAKGPVRLSVSGPGETAKAFYTLGYERALSVRGLFPLVGGERILLERSALSRPDGALKLWVVFDSGHTAHFSSQDAVAADGRVIEVLDLPADLPPRTNLRRLWVSLESADDEPVAVEFFHLLITRPARDTRLDADALIAAKPEHRVEVRPLHGVPAIFSNGEPVNGAGHTRMLSYENSNEKLKQIFAEDGLQGGTYRIVTTLGEDVWNALNPPTWLGPDHFDFSFPDGEAMRMHAIDPSAPLIFCMVLDGMPWWNYLHPDAAGVDFERGIPDYLSDEWRAAQEDAFRQFYAFLTTRPYYRNILGFELFNGGSMDCNTEINLGTPAAIARFRELLRGRYASEEALRAAWNDPEVTFETAAPQPDVKIPAPDAQTCPLLVDPATHGAYLDTMRFAEHVFQTMITDFCSMVKRVTGGDLLAGARTGDFMGNMWSIKDGSHGPVDTNPIDRLLNAPEMDFFEVQEPYLGRYLGADGGTGTPVLPFTSALRRNKLLFIQNDTPLHTGTKKADDYEYLLRHTRRVYVHAIVNGLYPYQFEVGHVRFNQPDLIREYRILSDLMTRAMRVDRSSVAEVAFVFDSDYQKFIGFDPEYDRPSRSVTLFDQIKYTWARAGVPYDMILLEDLPTSRDYKVFVFVHAFDLSPEERAIIEKHALREGKTAVFFWADGFLSHDTMGTATLSDLTGMTLRGDARERDWILAPLPALTDTHPVSDAFPMSALRHQPSHIDLSMDTAFCPSFTVEDPDATALAVYADTGETAVARKEKNGCAVYYSGPAILPPNLLRYIADEAGCRNYLDTEDACYVNASFVGAHAGRSGTVRISLPGPSPLTDVFTGEELPPASVHEIAVEKDQTLLFYRGPREAWGR
jgi:hypothetical protein